MTLNTSAKLTIFEGPDGSGKSTAARVYADATGAKYVHFPAMPRVTSGLARMYVEAMLPALLGYQDVVFDRCWLSEVPYGIAFRGGIDRMSDLSRRMLERLAFRCGAVVVICRPAFEVARDNFMSRLGEEMLDNSEQLKLVYALYDCMRTALPMVVYDYTDFVAPSHTLYPEIYKARTGQHLLSVASAGSGSGKIALIGEAFAERENQDPWYQWPFGSFDLGGCSNWLTAILNYCEIGEEELFWVNADQDFTIPEGMRVIALGSKASLKLDIPHEVVQHPQYWRRFRKNEVYPLIDMLRENK